MVWRCCQVCATSGVLRIMYPKAHKTDVRISYSVLCRTLVIYGDGKGMRDAFVGLARNVHKHHI